jgi:DNA-binding HxlR family transcriptional regulator
MRWRDIGEQTCPIARALSEVGDRWSLLVLREAFLGTRRFEDFQQRTGAARNVLSDRLEKLVEHEVLERRPYQEKPTRHEYRLTEKGLDLYPVMMSLVRWGDRWLDDGRGSPIEHRHSRSSIDTSNAVTSCTWKPSAPSAATASIPGPSR